MVGGHHDGRQTDGWGNGGLILRFRTWSCSTWDSDLMEGFRWRVLKRLWMVIQVDITCM